LEALRQANGEWVSAWRLHELSASLAVHSKVSELRRLGHVIENRVERVNGKSHSEYRLLDAGPPGPGRRSSPTRRAAVTRSENHKTNEHRTEAMQGEFALFDSAPSSPPSGMPWPD